MHFYCQLDYEHIPYPSPSSPHGNLANNGCGDREDWIGVFSDSWHYIVVASAQGSTAFFRHRDTV